jgi:hypothetical protein
MVVSNGIWDLNTAIWGHVHSLALAKALNDIFDKSNPIMDLGCGIGFYSEFLEKRGHFVYSYEGTPGISEIALTRPIYPIDLTTDYGFVEKGQVLCLEVGEHIPYEFEDIFVYNITKVCNSKLVLSWAVPGQGGDGHVNCADNSYIIKKIEEKGLKYKVITCALMQAIAPGLVIR